jgi:hypothetical protein
VEALDSTVPVYVGRGTLMAIEEGSFGLPMGSNTPRAIERLKELPPGQTSACGLHGGVDVFGDASFFLFEAPGVSQIHSL